jgi:hypothetical protein
MKNPDDQILHSLIGVVDDPDVLSSYIIQMSLRRGGRSGCEDGEPLV